MIRIGVAGIGHMGKMHLLNLSKLKDVKLVGIADKSKKNRVLANHLGVEEVYTDYSDLFEKGKLDAVIISLPNFLHVDSVKLASENDIDIMIDKPLARSVKEAEEIVSSINKNKTRLMVSTNFRYFPHVQKIKNLVDSGTIGDVILVTIEHIMNGPWSHPLYPRYTPDWWFNKELIGGGTLLDHGWHTLDIFTWMFGSCDIKAVQLGFRYKLDFEDSSTLIVKSKSGTQGAINCGWFSHVIFPKLDFRVIAHGTTGFLNTDELRPSSLYIHGAKEAILNFGRRIIGKPLDLLSYTYYFTSYARILQVFLDCLKEGTEFPVSLDQQFEVQCSIEKAYQLYEKGCVLKGDGV
ncbi:MAG: Gfo/Idh/MocA family protein [Candidatus Hodarchaeota archaeon]